MRVVVTTASGLMDLHRAAQPVTKDRPPERIVKGGLILLDRLEVIIPNARHYSAASIAWIASVKW